MTDLPHFSYPFRFATPQVAVSEQDSLDEITDCVQVILLYPQGSRPELPAFGLPDPTFSPRVDTDEIRSVIAEWEPRAMTTFSAEPDPVDVAIARVRGLIQVRTEE
jgi:phage baseplate assembly protein W